MRKNLMPTFTHKLLLSLMPYRNSKVVLKTTLKDLFGVDNLMDLPDDKEDALINHFMQKKEFKEYYSDWFEN